MSKRTAAAAAAAHAASKRNSAVELNTGSEERACQALQELNLLTGPAETQVPRNWDKYELVGQISDLCEALLAEGFNWGDVQNAVKAVPLEQLSEASVLDWLCLHVDPAHLPKRYAGGAQSRASASGIKLVAKAKGTSHSLQHKPTRPVFTPEQLAEQQRVKKLQQQAKEREAAAAAAKAAAEAEKAAEKEKEAQRNWILQYAEDDSESESDEESHSRMQGGQVIEDWEVWGDPREVERRKAERKRAAQPMAVRQAQVNKSPSV